MDKITSGNAEGLLQFLDQLAARGRTTTGSVVPLKTAVRQVVSVVDKDQWKETDMRNLDVADYIDRFGNMSMGRYTTESLKTYKKRLKKAVTWYDSFLKEPGWTPPKGRVAQAPQRSVLKVDPEKTTRTEMSNIAEQSNIAVQGDDSLITYPFPLRPGKLIRVQLPADLTSSEAKRLGRYIETLSVDVEAEQ